MARIKAALIVALEFIRLLFEEYKFARRALLVWAMGLITYCVVKVFENLALINKDVSLFLVAVVGLLTIVLTFYQRSRERDV